MLDDIKGERSFDVLADVMEIMFTLADDPNVMRFAKRGENVPEGEDATEWGLKMVKECVPAMIRDHRDALASVIALSQGTTKAKYLKEVTPKQLWNDVFAIFNDSVLVGFLA